MHRFLKHNCRSVRQRNAVALKSHTPLELLEPRTLFAAVVVNTTVDAIFPPNSGFISLRNAMSTAENSSTPTTITFDPTVFNAPKTILENGTGLSMGGTQAVTIIGPAQPLIIDGHGIGNVLALTSTTFSISNLTFTNGPAGGIYNGEGSNLTLTNVTLTGNVGASGLINLNNATLNNVFITSNSSTTHGGGIFNQPNAHLIINGATISGNSAPDGGGIYSQSGYLTLSNATLSGNSTTGTTGRGGGLFNLFGPATLSNVTASGNSSADGAGIDNALGAMTLLNSTIAGNTATRDGGGLSNGDQQDSGSGTLTVTNCTIYNNTGKTGGGMYGGPNCTTYMSNSIVAGNILVGSGATAPDASGSFNSLGFNLVGKTDGSLGSWNANDLTGTIATPLNPLLSPLDNFGGPTQTVVPLPGSPAINAGFNAFAVDGGFNPLPTDQRGFPRIVGTNVDIGAVEFQPKVAVAPAGKSFITLIQSPDHHNLSWTIGASASDPNAIGGLYLLTDPEPLAFTGNAANDTLKLDYSFGNPLPARLNLNGIFTITGLSVSDPLLHTQLDIGKSTVYISYTTPSTDPIGFIKEYLQNGYNNNTWTGAANNTFGTITSSAAAVSPAQFAVGYADSSDAANPAGLAANMIKLRYTALGDINLDGSVGLTDLTSLLQNYNAGSKWDQGDVDYNGSVGLTDLTTLLQHYNATAVSPSAAPAPTLSTDVVQSPAHSTIAASRSSTLSASTTASTDDTPLEATKAKHKSHRRMG